MKRKKKQPGYVKPLESIISADIVGPDKLVLQKEVLAWSVPHNVEVLDMEHDGSRINDLSYRFAYGSETIHISREDVLAFFGQSRTVVFDTISNESDKRTDRAVNMLLNLSSFQQSLSAIILIQTSPAAPIDMKELETIMSFLVSNLADKAGIKYGIGSREYLGNRIRLLVVCN